jgi:hypothetical protein
MYLGNNMIRPKSMHMFSVCTVHAGNSCLFFSFPWEIEEITLKNITMKKIHTKKTDQRERGKNIYGKCNLWDTCVLQLLYIYFFSFNIFTMGIGIRVPERILKENNFIQPTHIHRLSCAIWNRLTKPGGRLCHRQGEHCYKWQTI